jgi:hypothetical protein
LPYRPRFLTNYIVDSLPQRASLQFQWSAMKRHKSL